MKRLLSVFLCLALLAGLVPAFAEEEVTALPQEAAVEALGIPSPDDIGVLYEQADSLWEDESYSVAADEYANLAVQAGWMAEIISSVNSPYTLADADAQAAFASDPLAESVAKAKELANEYLNIRKVALARAGLCYFKETDYEAALPFLMEALKLISLSDQELWMECARAVLIIAGAVPESAE